jgi:hypothetical protein
MTTTHKIVLACDTTEAEQFAAFLSAAGHDTSIGRDTGEYIDGVRTSNDGYASIQMQKLWDAYCDSV